MPANDFPAVLHFYREVAIEGAFDDRVVTHRPIAIQAQTDQVDDKRIARNCRLDVEGSSFGITTHDARNALFVDAAGVNGGRVDRVAGIYRKNGWISCRELAIENGRREVVRLGRGRGW